MEEILLNLRDEDHDKCSRVNQYFKSIIGNVAFEKKLFNKRIPKTEYDAFMVFSRLKQRQMAQENRFKPTDAMDNSEV